MVSLTLAIEVPMFRRLPLRWAAKYDHAQERSAGAGVPPAAAASTDAAPVNEAELIERLRAGDEAAFEALVEMYYPAMLRVAQMYVSGRTAAEDVIQETWLGVLQGIDRFEGRSSLKTWIFRILTNTAKTRAVRDGRSVPFSALAADEVDDAEPAVDPDRFLGAAGVHPGSWLASAAPRSWAGEPEDRLLSDETRDVIRRAIEGLPPVQRAVITLRDLQGWEPEEIRDHLGVTDGNQRVLLHRARGKVRQALERYLRGE